MEKIENVRFSDNRIYITLTDGTVKSRPLEAFPILMDASDGQRRKFQIWAEGQSIRWDDIDEDIHISAFDDCTEPNSDNEVAALINSIGVIDIEAFAKLIGMRKTKLDLFRYGIWTPSAETLQKIKNGLLLIESRIVAAVGAIDGARG